MLGTIGKRFGSDLKSQIYARKLGIENAVLKAQVPAQASQLNKITAALSRTGILPRSPSVPLEHAMGVELK